MNFVILVSFGSNVKKRESEKMQTHTVTEWQPPQIIGLIKSTVHGVLSKIVLNFFFWSFSRSQNFLAWHIRQWKLYRGWGWWHPSNFDLLSWKCLKITSKMSRKNVIAVFCETGSWIFTRYIFWHRINFENRAAKMSFLLKIGAFARK